ncbi:hypothetical protein Tco_0490910 [Tanacetum coccineum]
MQRKYVVTGNVGGQNRGGNVNLGQAIPLCVTTAKDRAIARECSKQSVLRIQTIQRQDAALNAHEMVPVLV